MSEWYWRVIALKTAFVLTCFVSYLRGDDSLKQLPYCNPHSNNGNPNHNDLVLISTLDGKLSAFVTSNGAKAWDIDTKSLLSSNLHHVELTSGGKWVRLVPSLRGALYSVSGDTVEPLPFDAEQLLSSSFKYSEDLVIAGSRETLWTGIEPSSGRVLYRCGTRGCDGEQRGANGHVLVLRHHSSTVRALDPRTGTEKWNFSVGEHQVALSGECRSGAPHGADYDVGVALPDGVLNVKNVHGTGTLWTLKLSSPIAGMWRIRDGSLESLDVLWAATRSLSTDTYVQTTPPSLYIGIHDSQLYIQEGLLYSQKMETAVVTKPAPWKLKHTRPLITGPDTALQLQNADPNTLSLITLYGNIGQGENQGYFLYHEETCDQAVQVTEPDIDAANDDDDYSEHHHVHVHVYSLWFWWKEVLLIAISSALLMNLMIWPRFFAPKVPPPPALNQEVIVMERHYERPVDYVGRYESDFTPVRCLGKGGFGVVFEARNNIDHCCYAVKRITLPRRESKRERVLREVRALAKLEHEHIVRYFNAWLEEPPAHWQEDRDQLLMRELEGASLSMEEYPSVKSSSVTRDIAPQKSKTKAGSVLLNMIAHDYEGQLSEPSKRNRSFSCSDSLSIVFDENHKDHSSSLHNKPTLQMDALENVTIPDGLTLSKNLGGDEDSFIVFANSEDVNHNCSGLSEARNDPTYNKQLERVKDSEVTKTEASSQKKSKKKGHTRHWSLDLCVKSADGPQINNKMYLYIQMQLCLRESLHDWLRRNNSLEARRDKVKTLFSQIVSAVEYVHLAGLIHRDLKPSNIFFAPDGKVKVGDFGLVTAMSDISQDGEDVSDAIKVHTRHTYRVGTHLYMSPEQLRGRPYSYKVDIFSLGLVLFELLQPFSTEAERVFSLQAVRQGHFPQTFHHLYQDEMEVLKLMLSEDPLQRPTASGVRARAPLYQQTDEKWHFTLPNLVT